MTRLSNAWNPVLINLGLILTILPENVYLDALRILMEKTILDNVWQTAVFGTLLLMI